MKISTLIAAMCVAVGVASAVDVVAAEFGPRATEIGKESAAKPAVEARGEVMHRAGPRGTIAVRSKIDPTVQVVADDNSGSCHALPRVGPRASLC